MVTKEVAIVIVNYKGREDTLECLDSLSRLTYTHQLTIVVDNASDDGAPEAIRAQYPEVHVIESATNAGFAGGNNLGIRYALENGADYCFLLNNDTTVEPELLEPLVEYAEANPDVGVVGPLMCYYTAPETIWSAGGIMTPRADSGLRWEGRPAAEAGTTPEDVDFIVGCGMLVPRKAWERAGLFDERYFLYFEESDLCYRMRAAGFRSVFHPGSRLWHKVSRSTGAASELTLYYMRRNTLLFLEKNGTVAGRFAQAASLVRLFVNMTRTGKSRSVHILTLAVTDYLFRRFGRARHVFR